jgi:hypothetical protein
MTQYLEYPTAQGEETFISNGGANKVVLNGSSINILYDVLTNAKGVQLTGTGFTYNNGTTTTTVTWAELKSMANLLSALYDDGNPNTLTVSDQLSVTNSDGTASIVLSARDGVNQILLNGSAGTTGQFLTSGGLSGLTWTSLPPSTIHASVQVVSNANESPPITRLDINNPNGVVFINCQPSLKTYYLPTGMKVGYMVSIRNNSGASWKLSVAAPTSDNGFIYNTGSGAVEIDLANAASTFFLKYIGLVVNNKHTWII